LKLSRCFDQISGRSRVDTQLVLNGCSEFDQIGVMSSFVGRELLV
jgi:hypothetical protein